MAKRVVRANFSPLWAMGTVISTIWLLEPVFNQMHSSGWNLTGKTLVTSAEDMWVRGALVLLFIMLGVYEQFMLSRLSASESRYHELVENIPDVTWSASTDGSRTYLAPNVEKMLGDVPKVFQDGGVDLWWSRVHPDDVTDAKRSLANLFSTGTAYDVEYRMRTANGEWLWLHDRAMTTYTDKGETRADGVLSDVTDRRRAQESLHYASYFDPDTGLPNQLLLRDRLHQALAQSRRGNQMVAVMSIGLHGYREIEDTLGLEVAIPLIKDIVERVRTSLREEDTIARWRGDVLMVVLPDIKRPKSAVTVTQKILEALDTVLETGGAQLSIGGDVGLAFYPNDAQDVEGLLKASATAMERARLQGRNNYQLFTPDMHMKAVQRLRLEGALRKALERDEFRMYYQPKADPVTGHLVGTEALIRWESPEMGLVSPIEFIPLAEESGLIVPIGTWVLNESCRQNQAWQNAGLPHIPVAVNISGRQFAEGEISTTVAQALVASGLDPRYLELEITESALMGDPDDTLATLHQLKEMGLQLAIDDFGTGLSSLSYLKRFPIDVLKIDRSFIKDVADNRDDAALTGAIVALSHSLRLKVVAEGVETTEQLNFLRTLRCDVAQGYLFGAPMSAERMARRLMREMSLAKGTPAGGTDFISQPTDLIEEDEAVAQRIPREMAIEPQPPGSD